MESYLMMIYVTLEQESALKTFFLDHGWAFCKPDLSYTTDKLGPAAGTFPNIVRDDEFINNPSTKTLNEQSGKRKLPPPHASPSTFKRSNVIKSSEKVLEESGDNLEKSDAVDGADREKVVRKISNPITVQDIDGNSKAIKVEVTEEDDEYDPSGNYCGNADHYSAMNDDYNDDTDLDESYGPEGGMLNDSEMSRSSHLDASLNTDEDDSQAGGSKRKQELDAKQPTGLQKKAVYTCSKCSQNYQSKKSLLRHMVTHSGKKAYICHVCGADFFRKAILDEHMAGHDKSNPRLVCTFCDQRFVRKSSLYRHTLSHRPKNEWFKCDTCSKLFNTKGQLLKHQIIHTDKQQCEKCKKWFQRLNEHLRNCGNSDENYLPCKHCGKLLKNNKCLAEHVKYTHTNKKSYICSRCDKTFNHRASLFYHKKVCYDLPDFQ